MEVTKQVLLFIGEHILKPNDSTKHPLYPVYKKYLPRLKSYYDQAYYWHGTGRFHYQLKGQSKYDGVDFTQTYDVLQSIISTGGITPKFDPVVAINGKFMKSISLSRYRMYARAYAEFNQYPKAKIAYTYGSVTFWYYFLLPLQMLEGNAWNNILLARKSIKNKKYSEQTQPWIHTFRKAGTFRWTPFNFYKVRTDIPQNYSILFGIKREGVHAIPFNKILERFETRADNTISLEDITHIEVPLEKITETEELLRRNNIQISVIPLEIGEMYCNNYSLAQLSGIK